MLNDPKLPKLIEIDLDSLMAAMQDHSFETSYYLDLQTGRIIPAIDGTFDGENIDIDDVLDKEPDRYRLVESVSSAQAYRVMESFVDSLPHGVAQTVLRRAIELSKPFRGFKDALIELGDVKDQWRDYEIKTYKKFAEKWLALERIEASLVLAPRAPVE